jgi:hypothetical protein
MIPYPTSYNLPLSVAPAWQPAPVSAPAPTPEPSTRISTPYDTFQHIRIQPPAPQPAFWDHVSLNLHPGRTRRWKALLGEDPSLQGESAQDRLLMMARLHKALPRSQRGQLESLLKNGQLTDTRGDDAHSGLYYLYGLIAVPRAYGLNAKKLLSDAVRIASRPDSVSQKFERLNPAAAAQMLAIRQNPGITQSGETPPPKPLTLADVNVVYSATCVPSSELSRLAGLRPKEFFRQVHELSSPAQSCFEKAKFSEISPEDPAKALDVLEQNNIDYLPPAPGANEVTVVYRVPKAALLRAQAADKGLQLGARSGLEALLESTYAYMFTRKSYDPANDQRDGLDVAMVTIQNIPSLTDEQKQSLISVYNNGHNPARIRQTIQQQVRAIPNLTEADRARIEEALVLQNPGLTEAEKTLLERINEDDGSIESITYQLVGGKQNPQPGEESLNYVYGYRRRFEDTLKDLLDCFDMGKQVIIGITATDSGSGARSGGWLTSDGGTIVGGHELLLTRAFRDPKDGEIKFEVDDSDDGIPHRVIRSARELIPKIHHAGLPFEISQRVQKEMNALGGRYFVPDEQDGMNFDPMPLLNAEPPPEVLQQYVAPTEEAVQPAPTPQQAPAQPAPWPAYAQWQPLPGQLTMPQPGLVPYGVSPPLAATASPFQQPLPAANAGWAPVATI